MTQLIYKMESKGFPLPLNTRKTPCLLESSAPQIIETWEEKLNLHPDKTYLETLLKIIEFDALVGHQGNKSLTSTNKNPATLMKNLEKQILHHRMTQLKASWQNLISFPLGLVLKSNGGRRRSPYPSHLKGWSVNCNISKEREALKYASVDETIEMPLEVGPGAIFVEKDLSGNIRSDSWLDEFF